MNTYDAHVAFLVFDLNSKLRYFWPLGVCHAEDFTELELRHLARFARPFGALRAGGGGVSGISKSLANEIAHNWEQMAETEQPVARRETLRECADFFKKQGLLEFLRKEKI